MRLEFVAIALCAFVIYCGQPATGSDPQNAPPPFNPQKAELWLLSGQSNMVGWALAKEKIPTDPRVWRLTADGEWRIAKEPLHDYFVTSGSLEPNIRLQRAGLPATSDAQIDAWLAGETERGNKLGGVGPGLVFGKALAEALDRPIGLIHRAHGGTRMKQWDPATSGSLFYSVLDAARLATRSGGKISGVLWYQGESDALTPADAENYEAAFLTFIDRLRAELGNPALPFIYVQVGRFTLRADAPTQRAWETVHESQRRVAAQRPNVHMTSAIDLPLDDAIHLAFEGQQRLGHRLAQLALRYAHEDLKAATPIEFASAEIIQPDAERPMIRVKFKGVNGRLGAPGRAMGFELRDSSDTLNMIYRVDFDPRDPASVILGVFHPISQSATLWYGTGMDSPANITDERDMPIPAFGPIPLRP